MIDQEFYKAIEKSHQAYLNYGPRSNKKQLELHGFIARALEAKLDTGYNIISNGYGDNTEHNYSGQYYKKDLDITVVKDGVAIGALAVKFISTNYKQNANNYFESMLGETANVRAKGLIYGHVLVMRKECPYYSSDDGAFTSIENIGDTSLEKYINLEADNADEALHRPDLVYITLIETGDTEQIRQDLNQSQSPITDYRKNVLLPLVKVKKLGKEDLTDLSEESLNYIFKHDSFDKFIEDFAGLVKAKK